MCFTYSMKICNVNNKANFCGIKLSSNSFDHVRKVVSCLNFVGFDCYGHRAEYVSNTAADKFKLIKSLKQSTPFEFKKFGAVFLPWSKEAYLISTPETEQSMFSVIKNVDKKAVLNLL